MDYKNYYSILGIPRDADEQTIKSAFRQKARVYHPDVNANKAEATEKFKEINEAYTVLSDPDKRARYDLFNGRYEQYQRPAGGAGPRPGYGAGYSNAGPQPGYGAAGSAGRASTGPGQQRQSQRRTSTRTMDEEDFERIFRGFAWAYGQAANRRARSGSAGSDFSDFFEALFGNLWGAGDADVAREPSEARPGRDIEVTTEISLEEALRGATRTLTYSDGRKVEVAIPPGVDSGSKLRIRGQGERAFGRPRGDLFMTIQMQPHRLFTRDGADLRVQVTVDYETAMRSGEVTVPTMDNAVRLKIPAGTRSGQSFRLRGLGMPSVHDPSARGDLIAAVTVKAPTAAPRSTTEQARQSTKATQSGAKRRSAFWSQLRQALGAALSVTGLTALAAQTVLAGGTGWQLLAALAVVLLIHGVAVRSGWALTGGLLALGGAAWTASQAELITSALLLEQAWPLLPLAAGILLLRHPSDRR
jgi:DnaJ-class molecular chaperone